MQADREAIIESFPALRTLVIGDAMVDRYYRGRADRICREAPVPILSVDSIAEAPGGAANVAVNAAALGANVSLFAVVGDDADGKLGAHLAARGIDTAGIVVEAGRRTLAKQRLIAGSQLLLRFDEGDTSDLMPHNECRLLEALDAAWVNADAIVISDYAYGVLTDGVVAFIERLQAAFPRPLFVDAKDMPRYRSLRPTAVKPNYSEAVRLIGGSELATSPQRLRQIEAHGDAILDVTGAEMALVTLDVDGCVVLSRHVAPYLSCAKPHGAARGAGAGDSFLAAFALAMAAGVDGPVAADIAALAAALAVGRDETAVCTAADLLNHLRQQSATVTRDDVLELIQTERLRGKRVVFTNGCFDIVHSGHTAFLRAARELGDVLVVGLNSDESVARLKGAGRPVNTLEDRAAVLLALGSVDYVVAFDEDIPMALIETIKPDVFAKGGDYRRDDLPEAPLVEALGGVVRILAYLDDHSSSGIIERISRREVLA